jgi:hypothetical protein
MPEFSFRTPIKLHRALLDKFELPEEFNVRIDALAEKVSALKSDFEKLIDNMMVMA